jgi:hypothetical protein
MKQNTMGPKGQLGMPPAPPLHPHGFPPLWRHAGGEESSDDDEQGLEGYAPGQLLGYDDNGMPVLAGEYDSEDDSDYESEGGQAAARSHQVERKQLCCG